MLRSIGKGTYWTFLILIFGLSQLWIDLGFSYFKNPENISFYSIVRQGFLLFFTLAVTISVTMDYHFDDQKSRIGNLYKSTAFVFVPIVITGFVTAAYIIISHNPVPDKYNLVNQLNICACILTIIYAIGSKAYLFYRS